MVDNDMKGDLSESDMRIFLMRDFFGNQYLREEDNIVRAICGFTGSAGSLVLRRDGGVLFTDSRYMEQARAELDGRFEVRNISDITPLKWLAQQSGARVAIDGRAVSHAAYQQYDEAVRAAGGELYASDYALAEEFSGSRPFFQPYSVHGADAAGKLDDVLSRAGVDALLLCSPESVCHVLNIRGRDLPYVPIINVMALVEERRVVLYPRDMRVFDDEVIATISRDASRDVEVAPFAQMRSHIASYEGSVAVDISSAPHAIYTALEGARVDVRHITDPVIMQKARKNASQRDAITDAHIYDGAAVTHFIYDLKRRVRSGERVSEGEAARLLLDMRRRYGTPAGFLHESFETISATGGNGAIVHYHPAGEGRVIAPDDIYLVDSGGQYMGATTDITRTICFGEGAPDEVRRNYTAVLRGHIALAMATFPRGTSGAQLDALARAPLWALGLDYGHGTGHGVGCCLNVHEGPQGISSRANVPLEEGMLLSNEPGYYASGQYGIRVENLVFVEAAGEGDFLRFKTVSLAPMEPLLIDFSALNVAERRWLAEYHEGLQSAFSVLLPGDVIGYIQSMIDICSIE